MTQLRKKMLEELQRRNYAYRTAKTYVRIVREFAEHFHQPPDKLGPEQIRQYQAYLFQTKKVSPATVSQYVLALRFLFVKTLRRHFLTEYIPFPKCPKRLPTVLSLEEVARLIDSARNLYHRTLIMTLYSTAMRRSELCCLKVSDVDSRRMMILIQQGKGRRDRDVPLSPKLLETHNSPRPRKRQRLRPISLSQLPRRQAFIPTRLFGAGAVARGLRFFDSCRWEPNPGHWCLFTNHEACLFPSYPLPFSRSVNTIFGFTVLKPGRVATFS